MVNIKAIAFVLLVLPAIILAASSCSVNVKSSVSASSSSKYTTYSATATNTGKATVTSVSLTPSTTLKSLDGLTMSGNVYTISTLGAGASKTFSFKVKKGNSVSWSVSCSGSNNNPVAPSTAAPANPTVPAANPTVPASNPTTTAPANPTTAPSTGNNGRLCPAGTWWAPAPLTTWQWQLTGTIDTSKDVQMYDIDLFDATPALISTLHSKGRAVICYFSTQYENWRPDAKDFTASIKGSALDGWAGENYVDIRSTTLRNIMNKRLDLAVSKGCDGVEPDNVDGYQASTGFPLTAADQINFNTYLANQAHSRGLSVGLKNDLDQVKSLQPVFDWALNEQCKEYGECSTLTPFITAGKAVFATEYSGTGSSVCPSMNTLKFSALVKGLDLDASIKAQCCTYLSPSCGKVAHRCVSSSSSRDVRSVDEEVVATENNVEEITTQEFAASASTTYVSMFVVAVALVALNF